jgi:hypothetical protein
MDSIAVDLAVHQITFFVFCFGTVSGTSLYSLEGPPREGKRRPIK